MDKNTKVFRWMLLFGLFGIFFGCNPFELETSGMYPGEESARVEYAEVPVSLSLPVFDAEVVQTKGQALAGADNKNLGGVLFLIYRSSTGLLDSYRYFTASEVAAGGPYTLNVPMAMCDVYMLGNLVAVKRSDASVSADLMSALGEGFPMSESDLEAFVYRLDGGNLNGVWRRETMSEVRQYGIPYQVVQKGVNMRNVRNNGLPMPSTAATWLFSKVVVRVDHSMFDGGQAAKLDYFVNKTMYMRQANLRLMPFSTEPVKALEAADSGMGDYDASMSNASAGEYVFFVPENMQGSVAGISSSLDKQANNGAIPAAVRSYATYAEFLGTVNAGGFVGDVKYQFYLGENAKTDFNLQRGRQYNVTMSFSSENLFSEPEWKVDASLTDNRLFRLTADASFTTDIGDVNSGRRLIVRSNRVGKMYVYMNPSGSLGSTNLLLGKSVALPSSFLMGDMGDCSWYSAFMTSGTEDANWLQERGIGVSWNSATGELGFTCVDASKLSSHIGEERSFTLQLLPGGTKTVSFVLRLQADMAYAVADGKSLVDEFYLGQKRTLTVSGFSGSTIKYAAVQEPCGSESGTAKNANRQWKTVNSGSFDSGYPSCSLDSNGNVRLIASDGAYSSQNYSGSLDVYAWYPNRFLSSHSGWSSKTGKVVFFSEDWLNDSMEVDIRVSEPRCSVPSFTNLEKVGASVSVMHAEESIILNIDGTENLCDGSVLSSFSGSEVLSRSSFDNVLYDRLLAWSFTSSGNSTQKSLVSGITVDPSGKVYVSNTNVDGNKMEELSYSDLYVFNWPYISSGHQFGLYSLGDCVLSVNTTTGLYSGSVTYPLYLEKSSLSVYGVNTKVEGYQNKGFFTDYFAPIFTSDDGYYADDTYFGYSVSVSCVRGAATIDSDYVIRSGSEVVYVSSRTGKQYHPKPTVTVSGRTAEIVFSHDYPDSDLWDGTEFIPRPMIVPYGPQTFSYRVVNKWDGRFFEITSGSSYNIKFALDSQAKVLVFHSGNALNMEVATPLGAYLLSRYASSMPTSARNLCLSCCDVNLGYYVKWDTQVINKKKNYSWPSSKNYEQMTNGKSYGENASAYYLYDGVPSFSYANWTWATARRFAWEEQKESLGSNYYFVYSVCGGACYFDENSSSTPRSSAQFLADYPSLGNVFYSFSPHGQDSRRAYSGGSSPSVTYEWKPAGQNVFDDSTLYKQRRGRWIVFLGTSLWK